MGKVIPFEKLTKPAVKTTEQKDISGEALEAALGDIKAGYTEEEWEQMWEELDEMYPDEPEGENG